MAQYCTIAEMGRLGINPGALKSIPPAALNEALLAASNVMDGYLSKQFTLPLVVVQDDIKRACAIIATYDSMAVRGFSPDGSDEHLRLRYLDIIKWLEGIAAQKVTPPGTTDSSPGGTSSIGRARVVSSTTRGNSVRGTGAQRGPFQTD